MHITFRRAFLEDAPEWLCLQKKAYADYLSKYHDDDISPATETLARVRGRMAEGREHFFIEADGQTVGCIRIARLDKQGRYRLGGVFLLPEAQNGGIGFAAVRMIEARYPDAVSWELDTILQEARLLHFYEKLGYCRVGEPYVVNERMSLVAYFKMV